VLFPQVSALRRRRVHSDRPTYPHGDPKQSTAHQQIVGTYPQRSFSSVEND